MRYLIFNVTVLAALGYLFMASPNQSFTSWIGKAPQMFDAARSASRDSMPGDDPTATAGHALLEAVRALRVAYPDLGVKRLLAKLREQQPDLGAGTREVREALTALKAESEAPGSPSSTLAPLSEL